MAPEDQLQEAFNDVREFFAHLTAYPQKTLTLTLRGAKGKYNGADILINKPAGHGLNFME